jgi:GNAT superfamily N-acetyltransferase
MSVTCLVRPCDPDPWTDHSAVVLRPLERSDTGAVLEIFAGLGPRSRQLRFLAAKPRLTSADLRQLTAVDHHDHVAILAVSTAEDRPIGVARFVRESGDPESADVAVAVVDDWQGRGVATALLESLVERAREEGVARFVALVLSENTGALEMFSHLAPDAHRRQSASGNIELVFDLPEPGQVSESLLGRALHAAARGALVANPWRVVRARIAR